MKFIDLIGMRFERWVVVKREENNKWGMPRWLCKCTCGNKRIIDSGHLKSGQSKSCGCLQKELAGQQTLKHSHAKCGEKSKTYITWNNMKARCNNKNHPAYQDYGGRNPPITVCKKWSNKKNGFKNFLKDMGEIPKNKTLDRIDNNKGYFSNNCKLSTMREQTRNKRNNIYITFNNKSQLLIEWSKELNIPYKTLWFRIYKLKWSIEKALTTLVMK